MIPFLSFNFMQIGIIDPDCRLIGLHLYDGLFKVWYAHLMQQTPNIYILLCTILIPGDGFTSCFVVPLGYSF